MTDALWNEEFENHLRDIAKYPEPVIHGMAQEVLDLRRLSLREIAIVASAARLKRPKVITRNLTDEVNFKDQSGGGR